MTTTAFSYRERIALLVERKLQQTQEKFAQNGYMNADDLGSIAAPADFTWQPVYNTPDNNFYGAKAWGENFRALMDAHPLYVNPVDALAGRWITSLFWHRRHWMDPHFDYSELMPEQERYGIVSGIGAPQHFAGDYRIGFELGWGGLLAKVRQYRAQHGPEQAEIYDAWENILLGVQGWIRRHVEAIRAAEAAEPRPELRENLREMAEVNAWLVENPPRTLREACQWMTWFNLASRSYNGDGAGGWLDQLLLPFYERDRAEGRIDDETAIFYIACLLLSETQYYQLGGPLPDGRDATNSLSYLILEAAHRLGIACNLTIRVHDGMDETFFRKSVQHLFEDRKGWPRYSGDKALTDGFVKNGFSPELARQRIAVGCHWMVLPGREYTVNDCVKINAVKVFEVAFWEMMGGEGEQPSVSALWRRFEDHMRRAVLCTAKGLDFQLTYQQQNAPELMISLLCYGPVEQGVDASGGSLEYYNLCVDGSGLAVVADSFAALEQRIEREGVLTWAEIAEHLRQDFAGADGERVRLMMQHAERYGGGETLGDDWAVRVSRLFTDLVKASPTPGGVNMIPGWFSWSNTIPMGQEVGATPNGRRAGAPISHGANPNPGFRRDSAPTAMARAIAAIQPGWGNTAPMQLELDPGISREEGGIEKIASLIKTHFDLGGTLFNINVLDKETLLDAHRDPSKYPDLVVRVTGFTAYFATLSPEFRQLVVDRFIAEA